MRIHESYLRTYDYNNTYSDFLQPIIILYYYYHNTYSGTVYNIILLRYSIIIYYTI